MSVDIGSAIAQERKKQGISQAELADRSEISVDWVRKVEQGRHSNPSNDYLYRVAMALGIDPGILIPDYAEATRQMNEAEEYLSPERVQVLNASFHTMQKLSPKKLRALQSFLEVFVSMDDDEFQNPVKRNDG